MSIAYYNEFDKKAAAWLRELIHDGIIAPGDVDERSITDVQPSDLDGYTQCHFFAGVGGWSIAARLAGWADDREIWSASCPCQPFSVAGKGAGAADARHLWPDFFRLLRARRPAFIVGEQVAAAVGKDWFLGVRSDLEGIGYVGRGVVVPACAVNAPHRRDRLWFVAGSRLLADPTGGSDGSSVERGEVLRALSQGPTGWLARPGSGDSSLLEHTKGIGRGEGRPESELRSGRPAIAGASVSHGAVADADGRNAGAERQQRSGEQRQQPQDGGDRAQLHVGDVANDDGGGRGAGFDHAAAGHGDSIAATGRAGSWDSARWLISHDVKARRVEPSIPLLVDGLPARAPLLRGYGNAIVPALAAEVIGAWMDAEAEAA